MKPTLSRLLGCVNIAAGIALLAVGFLLPGPRVVEEWVSQLRESAGTATTQVGLIRDSLNKVDKSQVSAAAQALAAVTQHAADLANRTSIDFETVARAAEAMDAVATAMEELDPVLNTSHLEKVGGRLQSVAKLLDEEAAPAATKTSETLSKLATQAEQQSRHFSEALKAAKLDAGAVVKVFESTQDFAEAIQGADKVVATVRKELPDIAKNLETIASALRDSKNTWAAWAAGMKKGVVQAAEGLEHAAKILAEMDTSLMPSVAQAMKHSGDVMKAIAEGGKQLSEHKDGIDALLKDGPHLLASLGEEIGKFGRQLSEIVAETGQITAVSDALRASADQLKQAESALPAARKAVAGTAVTIRATQKKLAAIAGNREAFDDLGPRTSRALTAASNALEQANNSIASRVETQREILQQVEANCVDLQRLLPAAGENAARMALALKACAVLCGLTLVLHGARPHVWADRPARTCPPRSPPLALRRKPP
jgi:chromosome segregation ATPase